MNLSSSTPWKSCPSLLHVPKISFSQTPSSSPSAHADGDDDGVWEKEIMGTWSRLGQDFQGVEDERFIEKFRVTKCTFLAVHDLVKDTIDCQTTHLRK